MKEFALPKEPTQKWLKALKETPEEKHTTGKYRNGDCFCAMGLYFHANGIPINSLGSGTLLMEDDIFFRTQSKINKNIDLWGTIWQINDIEKLTFKRIAQWVKKNVQLI